ncbi:hypothetical protein [Calothrix sp. NIES-3974]|uniref:hypothetical protein n=1 Tax=Calothrix sp. NIES-3974 TaxID=2005462 RepID=UPI000B612CB9|nr:hypothetical protein [Calothrix sp. NIES-3974]BAZ06231.1 hypothetical protein NIES3974_28890 [Calothrix sp. NIES-3974]
MQATSIEWTEIEKTIARKAFDKAYARETSALIEEISSQAGAIKQLEQIWNLHDYLSARRHEIDGKYDYRYSMLVFVFARLVQEGWLQLEELEGLATDKLKKIAALSRM